MTAKILVVDDEVSLERLIKQRFRRQIRSKELEFIFASNGREALEVLQAEAPVDALLTDINMPEMDGLTLLQKVSEIDSTIKAVVVSAYGDLQNVRTAMNRGAFDFLTKPIDFDDLEITLKRTLEYVQQQKENLKELQQTQTKLIQNEKMASIGQLVAGVAHEINNPASFIAGNISHIESYIQDLLKLLKLYDSELPHPSQEIQKQIEEMDLDFLLEDLPKTMESMKEGTERICNISTSLRTFSRSDTVQKVFFNIHDGLESTLMILRHRLKANKQRPEIAVVKHYGELPPVECYPGQLNQVFMNIIANAIEAMEELNEGQSFEEIKAKQNTITITTEARDEVHRISPEEQTLAIPSPTPTHIVIAIADNGPGIPESLQHCIFEPFCTTKPVGKGTGLGLSISQSIVVEKHGGCIECISAPGKGCEFKITIPTGRGFGDS